ncbi:MAG: di/oligopeptide transporter, inner rane subunit [Actinomycetia bacterium]|nr:di/oligopeptide transporter, inner rane subunit [Actinomycetes bacterium]
MVLVRIAAAIPLMLVATFAVFALSVFLPGDAAQTLAGDGASQQRVAEIRHTLHLQDPLLQRYGNWLGNAVHGDLGTSLFSKTPVMHEIATRWSVSASLLLLAVIISFLIGVPAGILAAVYRGRPLDRASTFAATFGMAIPPFVLGIVLVIVFGVWLKWLPVGGYTPFAKSPVDWFRSLVLPAFALSGVLAATLARQLRGSLADVLDEEYIRTARAKGLRGSAVVLKHGLRMAAGPVASVMAVYIGRLIGGAVVVEAVFNLPGLGPFLVSSLLSRDLPVVLGIIPFTVLIVILLNLLAEVTRGLLDPRFARSAV